MITKETCEKIWHCHREIEAATQLIADMDKAVEWPNHKTTEDATLKDAFGRLQHLQLGIPSGDGGHRLYKVMPSLARSVITAHIADKKAELARHMESARIELNTLAAEKE